MRAYSSLGLAPPQAAASPQAAAPARDTSSWVLAGYSDDSSPTSMTTAVSVQ